MNAPCPENEGLTELLNKWLIEIRAHRKKCRAFGKVGGQIIDTPTGSELHICEETTFKPANGGCVMEAAMKWAITQQARRKAAGVTGKFHIEGNDVAGKWTYARVVETTIIGSAGLDATRLA